MKNQKKLELIRKVGIGGSFIEEEHTLLHHKNCLYIPELFDQTLAQKTKETLKDIVNKAHHKVESVLNRDDHYKIESEREKEIDKIVKKAEEYII